MRTGVSERVRLSLDRKSSTHKYKRTGGELPIYEYLILEYVECKPG